MVRGEYSEWVDVISGVPQGSVLGPILFLIYVNDIPEMFNCSIKMFADYTKLFRTVKYIDDCNILQNDLDTLSQWTNEWLLSFNVDKCKVMHIGKNNPKLEYTMRTENENKILIEHVIIIIYGPEWQFLTRLATSSTSRGMSRSTVIYASPRGQCSK